MTLDSNGPEALDLNNRVNDSFLIPLSAWHIQSSEQTSCAGCVISRAGFDTGRWYATRVPSTVLAALVSHGEYPDPYVGTHLREIPAERFGCSWWYRAEFDLSEASPGETVLLEFDGINYAAHIWLNGQQIGDAAEIRGAFRRFQLNVTSVVRSGRNALAAEVMGPRPGDFSTGFVDWNPAPPDRNMGLFRSVRLRRCRGVSLEHPCVHAEVDQQTWDRARLTISAELVNHSDAPAAGSLSARFDSVITEQEVRLAPRERKTVTFSPPAYPVLEIIHPRLWWPHDLGSPALYTLNLTSRFAGEVTDARSIQFGIRHLEDYLTQQGHRGYRINGRDVLIKAAGWTDDLLLADTRERIQAQLQYVRHMHLNAIRLEGIWGADQTLYDLCDQQGIMMMVGWSCHWEHAEYLGKPVDPRFGGVSSPDDIDLISRSWQDQVLWLRHHPSIFVWTVASDKVPHPDLERGYVETLGRYDSQRPYLASTGGVGSEQAIIGTDVIVSDISGPTGVKMLGPYDYTPPVYWYEDHRRGGAYGFNTETCPGAVVPVLESLQRMIPADHLWPIDEVWDFHCSLNAFSSLDRFCQALERRYGSVNDVAQFAYRAQALNYELVRPMFEAFRVHKGRATGVVQWMLNTAWPKLYWQLFDWYLMPTGAFYGTRKACEPVQLIYDYARHTVHLVNDTLRSLAGCRAEITIFDLSGKVQLRDDLAVDSRPQSSVCLLTLPALANITPTYFLRLRLMRAGNELASNFYWLSTTADLLDYDAKVEPWEFYTPSKQYADYRALNMLAPAELDVNVSRDAGTPGKMTSVRLTNTGSNIAFLVEVRAVDKRTGRSVVPICWSDNYVTLLPGECRTLAAPLAAPLDQLAFPVRHWTQQADQRR